MVWKNFALVALSVLLLAIASPSLAQVKIFNGNSGTVKVIDGSGFSSMPSPQPERQPLENETPQITIVEDGPVTITTEPDPNYSKVVKKGAVTITTETLPGGDQQTSGGQSICAAPQATVLLAYNEDQVVYDLSGAEAFEKRFKIVSDFSHNRDISYNNKASQGCLTGLQINLNIDPLIHLPAQLKVDGTGCKRFAQIGREKTFSVATADAYRTLSTKMEEAATQSLSGAENIPPGEAINAVTPQLNSMLADFDAAQAQRRASFKAAYIPVDNFDNCGPSGAETDKIAIGATTPGAARGISRRSNPRQKFK